MGVKYEGKQTIHSGIVMYMNDKVNKLKPTEKVEPMRRRNW